MAKQDKPQPQPQPPTPSPLPKNWPPPLPYLQTPSYSPSLTPSHLTALRTPPPPPEDPLPSLPLPRGPSPLVRITPITDPLHPAHRQSGLFATRDLRPGELIVPYLGLIHSGAAADAKSDYDLWLDRAGDVAVDAAAMGNEARFVNDYRGVPDGAEKTKKKRRPNAEFRDVWWEDLGERGMAVFVLPAGKRAVGRARTVGVGRGEEILVSYGKGFWGGRREGEGVEEEEVGDGERVEGQLDV
ncbi:hypothetical protein CONLIGDRAFT_690466 [Coniochaeta ligniaria NRRL 30616]|uniref:SET domain-containing protein n=1 Tax=Coniochaeta ligniaria NRRL 30616 TaxID=1408157 RepID=A0A1J7IBJ0_9PEZI|nr:hypothetical protein CONLIGDRAFT_690466 [Coniochaeta ligniaria NRRL 30616]